MFDRRRGSPSRGDSEIEIGKAFPIMGNPNRQFGCVTVTQLGFGGAEDDDAETDTAISVLRLKDPRPR